MEQNLFEYQSSLELLRNAPLADRMRPRTLDEFEGQSAILAEGRLLRRAINTDKVGNLILHGPPGVGKTTLARIIAKQTRSHFSTLNAVLAGVKDIRSEIDAAKKRLELYQLRSLLFIDEVHRFNSAQQDALLPWVENGTVVLIGATTENPFFEVNQALLSRSRLFRLQSLNNNDLHRLLKRALNDHERGYGNRKVKVQQDAADHLVNIANGDARSLLNALELAVESTEANQSGYITITLEIAEDSIQERAVLYDKHGDSHYDTISAFIKSLRGSDTDAALFWLARMIQAGESPRFIFRRMLISACEDVGLADPQAIVIVQACADAFDRVGMPEGVFHLSEAAIYLACAEKSNSLIGIFDAFKSVKDTSQQNIPTHLKDGNRDKSTFGDGVGYKYPHAYKDNWIEQQYLPKELQGEVFWKPSHNGWEGEKRSLIMERKAAQLAAMNDAPQNENLLITSSPSNASLDRWLHRQEYQAEKRMQFLHKKLWSDIEWQRHDRVLIIGDRSLLWAISPLNNAPEGGVTIIANNHKDAEYLKAQVELIDLIERPNILSSGLEGIKQMNNEHKFELIGGRLSIDIFEKYKPDDFLKIILDKCMPKTEIRFLMTYPCLGPAASLLSLKNTNKLDISDQRILKSFIEHERAAMEAKRFDKDLQNSLNKVKIESKWEEWEENISITIDNRLEARWLNSGSAYKNLIDNNGGPETNKAMKNIINQLKGKNLPQRLKHRRLICKTNNLFS